MKKLLCLFIVFNSYTIYSQDGIGKDSTAFLDSIYREMDNILDQLITPRSFVSLSLGAGTGFYNFKSASTTQPETEKKLLISPALSYLHKSGLGITGSAFIISNDNKLNGYQYALSPSYDYISRGNFSTGLTYTRYFTNKDLPFYTTPIQNETYAYFNYRKTWLQPGIALAYGWGSSTSFEERRVQLLGVRRKRNPRLITVRNDEKVTDLSALFSVRHNFSNGGLITEKDLLTFTPVLVLSGGTQSFGFNTSFQSRGKTTSNFLPQNQNITDKSSFDLQSTTMILRADYSVGLFFIQSQFLLDYYLHMSDKRLNNAVSISAGVNF